MKTLALFVILLSQVAFAQQATQGTSTKKKVVKSGKTVYDFEEADITGAMKRPEGQSIVEAPEVRFRRLLDLDESFIPSIIRSVDEF